MENLRPFIIVLLFFSSSSLGVNQDQAYFNKVFGHIHRRPSVDSASISIVECGAKVRIEKKAEKGMNLVKIGPYQGYVAQLHLSPRPVKSCPQKDYNRFFMQLKLQIREKYFWGKLYDNYQYGVVE